MGLPRASLTLRVSLLKLKMRRVTFFLTAKGLVQKKPETRAEPTYLPRKVKTLDSLGWMRKKPPKVMKARTDARTATIIPAVAPAWSTWVTKWRPLKKNTTRSTTTMIQPFRLKIRFSWMSFI